MTTPDPITLAKDKNRSGSLALQRGEYQKARTLLQEALDLDPDNREAKHNLSSAHILAKKFKDAIPLLEELTELEPNNANFWINLGAARLGNPILASAEKQNSAIEAFEKAYKISHMTPNAAYNIGLVYRDQQNYRKALYWFEQARAAFPDDEDAALYINQMLEKIAESEE